MTSTEERIAWAAVFTVLIAFAIPWFLWGVDRVVAGLPVWVWWHVGWLAIATGAFYVFTRRAWGIWIEPANEETPRVAATGAAADSDREGST